MRGSTCFHVENNSKPKIKSQIFIFQTTLNPEPVRFQRHVILLAFFVSHLHFALCNACSFPHRVKVKVIGAIPVIALL
jgi:hypothetical protein